MSQHALKAVLDPAAPDAARHNINFVQIERTEKDEIYRYTTGRALYQYIEPNRTGMTGFQYVPHPKSKHLIMEGNFPNFPLVLEQYQKQPHVDFSIPVNMFKKFADYFIFAFDECTGLVSVQAGVEPKNRKVYRWGELYSEPTFFTPTSGAGGTPSGKVKIDAHFVEHLAESFPAHGEFQISINFEQTGNAILIQYGDYFTAAVMPIRL